jgi:hypothetical protein
MKKGMLLRIFFEYRLRWLTVFGYLSRAIVINTAPVVVVAAIMYVTCYTQPDYTNWLQNNDYFWRGCIDSKVNQYCKQCCGQNCSREIGEEQPPLSLW